MGKFCFFVCALCTAVGSSRRRGAVVDQEPHQKYLSSLLAAVGRQSHQKDLASLLFVTNPAVAPGLRPRPAVVTRPTHVASPLKQRQPARIVAVADADIPDSFPQEFDYTAAVEEGAKQSEQTDTPSNIEEVFSKELEALSKPQRMLGSMPALAARILKLSILGASGAAGFALTPTSKTPLQVAGALAAAVLGNKMIGSRSFVNRTADAVIVKQLAKGLENLDKESFAAIASKYGIPKESLKAKLKHFYLVFLRSCFKTTGENADVELSQLVKLQHVLGLSNIDAANRVFEAAKEYQYSAYARFNVRQQADARLTKFVFLAEGIISRDESPEAYRYESKRLQKLLLNMSPEEWVERVDRVAVPIYEKRLRSAYLEPDKKATPQQLSQLRESLRISTPRAEETVLNVFNTSVTALLNLNENSKLSSYKESLDRLRALLNMSEDEYTRNIGILVKPLYRQTFEQILDEKEVLGKAESDMLTSRQEDLLLSVASARSIEEYVLNDRLQSATDELTEMWRYGVDTEKALESMQVVLDLWDKYAKFMIGSNRVSNEEELTKKVMVHADVNPIQTTYQRQLMESYKNRNNDGPLKAFRKLFTVLGFKDSVANTVAGDVLRKLAKQIIQSDFVSADQKADMKEFRSALGLPRDVVHDICIDVYSGVLKDLAKKDFISDQDYVHVGSVREALGLDMNSVHTLHEELLGPTYTSAISEGVDFDLLESLQRRLGITDEASKKLYMTTRATQLANLTKSAAQACLAKTEIMRAIRNRKDKDDDDDELPTPKPVSPLVAEMLDFVESNDLMQNGKFIADFPFEQVLGTANLYKEYLFEQFTDSDFDFEETDVEKINKFQDDSRKIATILATGSQTSEAASEVVIRIMRTKFADSMSTTDSLEPKAKAFLEKLADFFGLDVDEPLRQLDETRLTNLANRVQDKGQLFAEDVRLLIDMATEVKLPIGDKVPERTKDRMLSLEIKDLIEEGEITPGDFSALETPCEVFGISEERMLKLLLQVAKERGRKVLDAYAKKMQRDNEGAAKILDDVAKYLVIASPFGSVTSFENKHMVMQKKVYSGLLDVYKNTDFGDKIDHQARTEALEDFFAIAREPETKTLA